MDFPDSIKKCTNCCWKFVPIVPNVPFEAGKLFQLLKRTCSNCCKRTNSWQILFVFLPYLSKFSFPRNFCHLKKRQRLHTRQTMRNIFSLCTLTSGHSRTLTEKHFCPLLCAWFLDSAVEFKLLDVKSDWRKNNESYWHSLCGLRYLNSHVT